MADQTEATQEQQQDDTTTNTNTSTTTTSVLGKRPREETEEQQAEQPAAKKVKKLRKARQQVPRRKNAHLQKEEGQGDFNIWFGKYIGQPKERFEDKEPASTRCSIVRDAGWSKGCDEKEPFFCLFFARGSCDLGADCRFLHRLPTERDALRIPMTRDCFGREKHATDREDMGGVGSFQREGKTLYVGGLKNVPNKDMEEVVTRHFKEWGQIEYVRVITQKCYAFIRFKCRLNAEFAKEAMANQALDDEEIVNIRWAADDPNPMAVHKSTLEVKTKLITSLQQKGVPIQQISTNPALTAAAEQTPATTSKNTNNNATPTEIPQAATTSNAAAPAQNAADYYNYYYQYYQNMYYNPSGYYQAQQDTKNYVQGAPVPAPTQATATANNTYQTYLQTSVQNSKNILKKAQNK